MGGGQTINQSDTRVEALRLQSSAYGVTVPIVGGVNRITGNLLYYSGFKAVPFTEATEGGGKGGGAAPTKTTFTYYANVIMGLAHGLIVDVPRVWRGKEKFERTVFEAMDKVAIESYAVPALGGSYTVLQSAKFSGLIQVRVPSGLPNGDGEAGNGGGATYTTLAEGVHYTINDATVTFPEPVGGAAWEWWGDTPPVNPALGATAEIEYRWTEPRVAKSAVEQLGLTLVRGKAGNSQPPPSWVTSLRPAQAINYPFMAYLHKQEYQLGPGAEMENHNFEVVAYGAYTISDTTPDCNPAKFTRMVLLNDRFGARLPASRVDALTDWSNYCLASGLLLSPVITEQIRAADMVTKMAQMTNSAPVWDVNRLRMIPFADQEITGNGVTFTPNVTPIYDLTDDHFLAEPGEDPVRKTQKQTSDRFNHFRVEFVNRDNQYNIEVLEAKDDADIATNGLRTADTFKADWVCSRDVAKRVAQLLLQRSLNVVSDYDFKLPWSFCMLQPMDLVTITDESQSMSKQAVRILSVEEDEDRRISITAEDFPLGVATAALYDVQVSEGHSNDYNATPGNVLEPLFFEAPVSRTESPSGLEVYMAVTGQAADALWGGCSVWVSIDGGLTYEKVDRIIGGSRYGKITAAIGAADSSVSVLLEGLGGKIFNASAAAANRNRSLIWISGADGGEYMNYVGATLNSANAYTLTGLIRAAYANPANSHVLNARFVRVDDRQIGNSGPLDANFVGNTLHVKFTSFNVYGAGEQSIADVVAYTYTITGQQLKNPPPSVTGFVATVEDNRMRLSWNHIEERDITYYEIRYGGTSWETATLLTKKKSSSHLTGLPASGVTVYRIKAHDRYKNYSLAETTLNVNATPPPDVGAVTKVVVRGAIRFDWDDVTAPFLPIAGYEVRSTNTGWGDKNYLFRGQTSKAPFMRMVPGLNNFYFRAYYKDGRYSTTSATISHTFDIPATATSLALARLRTQLKMTATVPSVPGDLKHYEFRIKRGVTTGDVWGDGLYDNVVRSQTAEGRFPLTQLGTYRVAVRMVDIDGNASAASALLNIVIARLPTP